MPKGKGRATVTQLSYNTIFLWGSTCSFSLYPFSYLSQCWILVNHADPSLSYPIVGHDTHVLNIIHPPTHLSIHPFLLHSHLILFALPTYCCSQKPNWIGWKALSYTGRRACVILGVGPYPRGRTRTLSRANMCTWAHFILSPRTLIRGKAIA